MVGSSDKTWLTGERNGKPLQYSCLENPMNSIKNQKDRTLKLSRKQKKKKKKLSAKDEGKLIREQVLAVFWVFPSLFKTEWLSNFLFFLKPEDVLDYISQLSTSVDTCITLLFKKKQKTKLQKKVAEALVFFLPLSISSKPNNAPFLLHKKMTHLLTNSMIPFCIHLIFWDHQ